jgi:hypothetical protein
VNLRAAANFLLGWAGQLRALRAESSLGKNQDLKEAAFLVPWS